MLVRITDYLTLFLAMGITNYYYITTSHVRNINNITIYVYKIIIIYITRMHVKIVDTYLPIH